MPKKKKRHTKSAELFHSIPYKHQVISLCFSPGGTRKRNPLLAILAPLSASRGPARLSASRRRRTSRSSREEGASPLPLSLSLSRSGGTRSRYSTERPPCPTASLVRPPTPARVTHGPPFRPEEEARRTAACRHRASATWARQCSSRRPVRRGPVGGDSLVAAAPPRCVSRPARALVRPAARARA